MDWHERQQLLKFAFPLDVRADRSASEVQFGHVHRPTNENTSWEAARFEVAAHRWVHVAEPGFGVAIANDSSYGHDITRRPRIGGGTYTLVRQSLLRAPLYPDPESDQGQHVMRSSLTIAPSISDAIAAGYSLNLPLRPGAALNPLVSVEADGVFVESVKLAEDRSGDVIVRLYEGLGRRSDATITPGFAAQRIMSANLLEDASSEESQFNASFAQVSLRPFEILTLRITPV